MIEEIKVLKNEKTLLEIEVMGAGEGFGEMISYYLNNEAGVEFAAYKREHPLDKSIKVVVKTKTGDPKKKLLSVLKKVKDETESLEKAFKKV